MSEPGWHYWQVHHDRRARPTLRLLQEDLTVGWNNAAEFRAVVEKRWDALQPLAELSHPVLVKAAELYGDDPTADPPPRPIQCASALHLQELRSSQWRAGIWTDPETGVRWVCAAGLAKGNHADADDFYLQLASLMQRDGGAQLLPTTTDLRLLRRETAAWLKTSWELDIQAAVLQALLAVGNEVNSTRFGLQHPNSRQFGVAELTFQDADSPECEEFVIELTLSDRYRGSNLEWTAITRILVSVSPPTQDWDRFDMSFSTIAEPGHRLAQITRLRDAVNAGELLQPTLGTVSHYAHRNHIAKCSVEGRAMRAVCGVYFVPMQDHADLPVCPLCDSLYAALPR